MFKAKLSNSAILKKVVDSLKDFVSIVNVDVLLSGLQIRCLDQVRIAMAAVNLMKEDFEVYSVDSPLVLGLNFVHLSLIMKLCRSEDSVILVAKKDSTYLLVMFENKDTCTTASFKLNLFDIDCDNFDCDEIEDGSTVIMSSINFAHIINKFKDFGDSIYIEIAEYYIEFSCICEMGSCSIKVNKSEEDTEDAITIENGGIHPKMFFSLRYLLYFVKSSSLSKNVKLTFSDLAPFLVEYEIGDFSYIKYYLAPKIQD